MSLTNGGVPKWPKTTGPAPWFHDGRRLARSSGTASDSSDGGFWWRIRYARARVFASEHGVTAIPCRDDESKVRSHPGFRFVHVMHRATRESGPTDGPDIAMPQPR